MTVVLKKGKQRELIFLAKGKNNWSQLGKLLNCSPNYLNNDLKYELRYLSNNLYERLCKISNKNFDELLKYKITSVPLNKFTFNNKEENLKNVSRISVAVDHNLFVEYFNRIDTER